LAHKKRLWLMEDAAHAQGASLDGIFAGNFGRAGSFSFYPTKVMTSGEGGMIVTADETLMEEARIYRDQGKAGFYQNVHIRMGYNWRMSEPHAIIGLRHLHNVPAMLASRRRIAARYDAALHALADRRADAPRPLATPPGCVPNYYKYVVMLPKGVERAPLKARLKDEFGILCSGEVYEAPLQKNPVLSYLDTGDLPGSLDASARQLCLPIFASMTDDQADRVIAALEAIYP
jgi:perosamine synthetase